MHLRHKAAVIFLVAAAFSLMFVKARILGPKLQALVPELYHEILVRMRFDGHGEDVEVRMALPVNTSRQSVRNEMVNSAELGFHMESRGGNRWGVWVAAEARGSHELVYSSTVRTRAERFLLAPSVGIPERHPQDVQAWLLPTAQVQSEAPEIRNLLSEIVGERDRRNATAIVRAAFDYCHRKVRSAEIRGMTDALTCLRLAEASCGGKSRLLAALLRSAGIPARVVGGLILKEGSWTASHVWVEAWIGGTWVPFCPLNGRFAETPESYLLLYRGDEPLFKHTRDINFTYVFYSRDVFAPPSAADSPPAGILNLWAAFEGVGIPVDLLKIILLLPFGALAVVIARNVVGIQTFGTFMPALVAVGFRETGLVWGTVLLAAILAVGATVRTGLDRFQLLHTPRLAVILSVVVAFIIALALFGQATGHILPTRVSLFPLVILTLTVERFATAWEEDGPGAALLVTVGTMVVTAGAYAAMEWRPLQASVLAFPEAVLLAVAAFFIVGRWTGLRVLEHVRFRALFRGADAT